MDINKTNENLSAFWDEVFKKYEAKTIQQDDLGVNHEMDAFIKEVADHSTNILDFGCGNGYGILTAHFLGSKMEKGVAIDPSTYAIKTLQKTLELSKVSSIEAIQGTEETLKQYPDGYFDGMLCSNVLDVVPYETSGAMIKELSRVCKKGALFFVKLNFYLTKEIIKRTNAEEVAPNTFFMNGVLRAHNLSTEEWMARFEDFEFIKEASYERIKDGPLDRVLLLRKKEM